MLHEHHVIYSIQYYLWIHITTVGLALYYPWIWGHYCIASVSVRCVCLILL
jgi:hypothetical protein